MALAGLAADVGAVAAAAAVAGVDALQWVLGGGEDHALVATFTAEPPPGWRIIGRVREAGAGRVTVDGGPWAGSTGWQSY